MDLAEQLAAAIGDNFVLTGAEMAPWSQDWTGKYAGTPLAVLRPADTAQVSACLKIAHDTGTPVVPVSGNTNVVGAAQADGALALSLNRMGQIRDIRPEARIAIVEAGVILENLHNAVADHDLIFPMTFGAKGSARIGGMLSTNAGGSNVLKYGNMRDLCLGIEVVLADGRVMNLMSELHKDNSGLNLRHLMIGAEGTLGIITAAVLKLRPKPRAYATAMLAMEVLAPALDLLNRLQDATGGAVEAFEFMPRAHIDGHMARIPGAREPFDRAYPVNILVELGATAPRDADPLPDGTLPIANLLEEALTPMLENGTLMDAVIAQSDGQRSEMWARREAAAEITFHTPVIVDTDIALPLDQVCTFFDQIKPRVAALDGAATDMSVAHLGDGNIHYTVYPSRDDADLNAAIKQGIEDLVTDLGGSFSAEHGVGLSKLSSMSRYKDPAALDAMRAIKAALDPRGSLNPGKVIPT
jgi:FAD/FMN-containing dehydrogenase